MKPDDIEFTTIREGTDNGEEILDAVCAEAVEELDYFFSILRNFSRPSLNAEYANATNFVLDDLIRILENIQKSTMGAASEEDSITSFEDMDLGSTKLGRTVRDRNDLVAKIMTRLTASSR